MPSKPYFSVIIPTLNEARFVGDLLTDLVHQDYKHFEIIHVDAGSSDDTWSIVDSYRDTLDLRQISSDRRNLSYQRNLGAQSAQSDYLIFVDADSRIQDSEFLSKIHTVSLASCPDVILPYASFESESLISRTAQWINNTAVKTLRHTRMAMPSSGLCVFRRDFFVRIRGYLVIPAHDRAELFAEDQEIMERVVRSRASLRFVDEARYGYSTRRYERDGWLIPLLRIAIISSCRLLRIRPPSMAYAMGGHY